MKWLRERASEVCCINAVKCAAVLWEEQSDGRIASFLCKRFNVNWGKNPWHRHIRGCHGITSDPGRPHKSASGSVRSAADSHCNTQNKCKWCPVVFKGCSWCQISLDTNYLLPGKPTEKKKWRIKKRKKQEEEAEEEEEERKLASYRTARWKRQRRRWVSVRRWRCWSGKARDTWGWSRPPAAGCRAPRTPRTTTARLQTPTDRSVRQTSHRCVPDFWSYEGSKRWRETLSPICSNFSHSFICCPISHKPVMKLWWILG